MTSDPGLRAEVSLARRLGISYKRLKGWEPVTTYTYDGDGRLVSSRPEVEWDETEQAWMSALDAYEASLCEHCGLPRDVCHAPTLEGRVKVPPPSRCHVHTAMLRAQNDRASYNQSVANKGGARMGQYDAALSWGFTLPEPATSVTPTSPARQR
ncbi:hypothetical protein GCM10025864_39610 [Luteimicrobium album]|uniref:4Fe-4S Wbl-type domain-containing protein n=1 Tax=Luteimicrobium album TaxID=1054550 RepID=A0ABQ6I6D5_9MICO|nr:hypothetical protein [Luteimicrobium album]GMA26202.1 hypothetical protein GCM10025864_39610 [Luteimicrobium album]